MVNIQEEIWKPIFGYDNYKVSNLGRFISVRKKGEKYIKTHINHKGYVFVTLYNKNVQKTIIIHRLVAIHFVENPLRKPEVNHKNGIKTDNRAENLEWSTRSENVLHAYRVLGCTNKKKMT